MLRDGHEAPTERGTGCITASVWWPAARSRAALECAWRASRQQGNQSSKVHVTTLNCAHAPSMDPLPHTHQWRHDAPSLLVLPGRQCSIPTNGKMAERSKAPG